ncbi:aminoglycoside phosphotransferase family protein [Pseudoalteromonas sp. MMG022]|uniref:aminoglycoside phosphotransferase family protein n=1 Tax=Pseudoalteromonas sp. MMG022 TaxID=2909978 RepID=UPI001F38EA59|nr:aminoglycoside phosphotransferase family protein [Pseudoalteromonas sp. MMG022]MCF6434686.1 aminoglycoside phosphotransferase family protein [Pseudoalteromonas sp. MMG022]
MKDFVHQHVVAPFELQALSGGANSRVYYVHSACGQYILKQFFTRSEDYKEKCLRELNFLNMLMRKGMPNTAKVIAHDIELGLLLTTHLPGEKITSPTAENVKKAFEFIVDCNQTCAQPLRSLPQAKDAVTTLRDFITLVENRIAATEQSGISPAYQRLINTKIKPLFADILTTHGQLNWEQSVNCVHLSPSDFGFHNILQAQDTLYFFDFEYAGIDSLWKLTADFFAQPQIPAPIESISVLKDMPLFGFISEFKEEFIVAYQLTRIKWCFIIGSCFITQVQKRRAFADKGNVLDEHQTIKTIEHYLAQTAQHVQLMTKQL